MTTDQHLTAPASTSRASRAPEARPGERYRAVVVTATRVAILVGAVVVAVAAFAGCGGAAAAPGSPSPTASGTADPTASGTATPTGAPAGPVTSPAAGEPSTPGSPDEPGPSPTRSPTSSRTASGTPTDPPYVPPTGADHRPGDVDADGRSDRVELVAAGDRWELVVATTSSGELRTRLPADVGNPRERPARLGGSSDLDADGRAEVWVGSSYGAYTGMSWAVRYDGTTLGAVTLPGVGSSPVLAGASVAYHLTAWCEGSTLRTAEVEAVVPADDDSPRNVSRTSYEMSGFTWVELGGDRVDGVPADEYGVLVDGPECETPLP